MTLDYKALQLLLYKTNDEEFLLGGKGYGVEFCAFCDHSIKVPFLIAKDSLEMPIIGYNGSYTQLVLEE